MMVIGIKSLKVDQVSGKPFIELAEASKPVKHTFCFFVGFFLSPFCVYI